jgi:hypothetical protein
LRIKEPENGNTSPGKKGTIVCRETGACKNKGMVSFYGELGKKGCGYRIALLWCLSSHKNQDMTLVTGALH